MQFLTDKNGCNDHRNILLILILIEVRATNNLYCIEFSLWTKLIFSAYIMNEEPCLCIKYILFHEISAVYIYTLIY